ncbi:MAG: DUF3862 domain-containing protein [Pyrinomonadaceae bacterium]
MKTCPKCTRKYDFNMSFCLDDGSPLVIDEEAETLEKLGTSDISPGNTSSNQTRETDQQRQATSLSSSADNKPGRSYLGIIVGIFALGSFLLITLGIAGGVWWYLSSQPETAPGTRNETREESDPPVKDPSPPVKKTGALTMENYKKVKPGMTYKEVVEILGEEGDEVSSTNIAGFKTSTYMWRSGSFTNVTLTFQNEKLMSKFQMGLD